MMNVAFTDERIRGRVADIGGGRNPDYFQYVQKDGDPTIEAIDGSISGIDFETDALPFKDGSIDTVISCNVLEHIFDYMHLTREMRRIMAPDGSLIGFVPFWVGYHADPHDYFRYTAESLERILLASGFGACTIRTVGQGPFLANFNTLVLSIPRPLRPILYLLYAFLDHLMLVVRPRSRERNPLGFIFTAHA